MSQQRNQKLQPKGSRFTTEDKILALSIFKQSGRCYRYLSQIFSLPSRRTLTYLLSKVHFTPGINTHIFAQLKKTVTKMTGRSKYCVLMFDEISLQPDLQYNPTVKACKSKLDTLLVLCKYNPQYRELYNLTKKEYDTLVINKKSSLYEERITSSDNKNKTMWFICNEILGKNNKYDQCQIEGDPIDIANNFNNFLINVVPNMRDFPKQPLDFQNIFYNNCSLYCGLVKGSDIIEAAACLKNKYSSGEDDIPICIVKFSINQIKEVLAYIVGNSFKYGIFPEQLKMAVIKPLFKSGERDSMNSYQPISMLNSFSKLF
nr:unnamed protein product [Callosobruchus analis]